MLTVVEDYAKNMIALAGSTFFVGWVLTLLWVPRLSDMHGRRKVQITGMSISVVLYTAMLFIESLDLMIIILFCLSAMRTVIMALAYVYMIELMPREY